MTAQNDNQGNTTYCDDIFYGDVEKLLDEGLTRMRVEGGEVVSAFYVKISFPSWEKAPELETPLPDTLPCEYFKGKRFADMIVFEWEEKTICLQIISEEQT